MYLVIQLSLDEVLADIPLDIEAIFVYLMLFLFLAFIWHGSLKKGHGSPSSGSNTDVGAGSGGAAGTM